MNICVKELREKAVAKCMRGLALGMAAVISMTPATAFAQSKEPKCTCEVKCSEDEVNKKCEVCKADESFCEGQEVTIIEDEVWGPLSPDGNLDIVDDYGSLEAGGKQFITVTTKSGNYFYIIIDRDDQGAETVHFLNLVDESDLLALMEDEEVEKYMETTGMTAPKEEETPVIEEKEPETEEPVEKDEKKEKKTSNTNGIMALVLVIALGGAGGFLYYRSTKGVKNTTTGPDPDEDYTEDNDFLEDLNEEYDTDFVEDSNEDDLVMEDSEENE